MKAVTVMPVPKNTVKPFISKKEEIQTTSGHLHIAYVVAHSNIAQQHFAELLQACDTLEATHVGQTHRSRWSCDKMVKFISEEMQLMLMKHICITDGPIAMSIDGSKAANHEEVEIVHF